MKRVDHYTPLGSYDVLDIYEAASTEAALNASLITIAERGIEAETWCALQCKEFLRIATGL